MFFYWLSEDHGERLTPALKNSNFILFNNYYFASLLTICPCLHGEQCRDDQTLGTAWAGIAGVNPLGVGWSPVMPQASHSILRR